MIWEYFVALAVAAFGVWFSWKKIRRKWFKIICLVFYSLLGLYAIGVIVYAFIMYT